MAKSSVPTPAATAPATETNGAAQRRPMRRSPNFPYIDLPTALERIRALYAHEHRNPTPWAVVAQHWDYTATSSSMDKTVGALNAYGLVEIDGSGTSRTIRLSERALDIVEDEREESTERTAAIRAAALGPAIHRTIRDRFGRNLPSDANLRTVLVRELDFNPNAVGTVIANYRTSIEHAGLDRTEEPPHTPVDRTPLPPKPEDVRPAVGDLVQWTSQGIAQFTEPRRLVSVHEDGVWAFVEGSQTGVPVAELTVVRRSGGPPMAQATPPPAPPAPPAFVAPLAPAPPGVKTETFALDTGEITVRFPSKMTADDFENVKAWIPILQRKFSSTVQKPEEPKP